MFGLIAVVSALIFNVKYNIQKKFKNIFVFIDFRGREERKERRRKRERFVVLLTHAFIG